MIMIIKSSWKTTRNPLEQLPLVRLFTNQQKAQISRLQESSETQTKLPGFILNNCSQIVEPRNGNVGKSLATTLCRWGSWQSFVTEITGFHSFQPLSENHIFICVHANVWEGLKKPGWLISVWKDLFVCPCNLLILVTSTLQPLLD